MIETSLGERPGGWQVVRLAGSVDELHGRQLPADPSARQVWVMAPDAPAVVLGSTQRDGTVVAGTADDHLAVVRRRSGGGAVLVDPDTTLWVDVVVGRADRLWHDDVGRAFEWLGDAWAGALASLGFVAEVHRGPLLRSRWSTLVCFAGTGPGEVLVGGRKVVGLSQRRTRTAARFQCAAYLGDGPGPVAAVADEVAGADDREALRAALSTSTTAVAVGRGSLVTALLDHLPP